MDVLLPVCVSVAVLGVVVAVVLWSRHRRGRALQAAAVASLPFGLYLTGLLPLVWSGAVELVRWAGRVVFSPPIWAGTGLIALAVVLWVVGGMVARRTHGRPDRSQATKEQTLKGQTGKSRTGRSDRSIAPANSAAPAKSGSSGDSEFDDIEALLRKRGIE